MNRGIIFSLIVVLFVFAPCIAGSESPVLKPYIPPQKPPQAGIPGKAHHVYHYDGKSDRLIFGGLEYTLNEKRSSLTDHEKSVLYERNLATGTTRVVFNIPGRSLAAYSVSPDGRYVAVRSWVDDNLSTMALHVINSGGHEIAQIGQVVDYAWSPDGNQLAYVTAAYNAGPDGGDIHPTGVWRYDLRQRMSTKLQDVGRHVAWAAFDGAVYVLDYSGPKGYPRVWRLNSTDWKTQLTPLQSIYFSPTGKYYYHPGTTFVSEGKFDVYDVATNTPRFATSSLKQKFAWGTEPIGWVESGGNHLLLLTWSDPDTGQLDPHPHTVMYDLDAGTIQDLGLEEVIGWKHGAFLTHREGKFQQEQPFSPKR